MRVLLPKIQNQPQTSYGCIGHPFWFICGRRINRTFDLAWPPVLHSPAGSTDGSSARSFSISRGSQVLKHTRCPTGRRPGIILGSSSGVCRAACRMTSPPPPPPLRFSSYSLLEVRASVSVYVSLSFSCPLAQPVLICSACLDNRVFCDRLYAYT